MDSIDLGRTYDGPKCCPTEAAPCPEKTYPGTYITVPASVKIPPEGYITFEYKLTGARAESTEAGGKLCLDLELRELKSVTADDDEAPEMSVPSVTDALATYAAQLKKR